MSLILTQHEADALLALEKHYQGEERFFFPGLGGAIRIPLYSAERREEFSLDITRGRIVLEKNTFQSRARKAVILARLDLGGPSHRNPDGEEIARPLHAAIARPRPAESRDRSLHRSVAGRRPCFPDALRSRRAHAAV